MADWLALARGPIFRFAFVIMALGLLRQVVLTMWDIRLARQRAGSRQPVPYKQILKETAGWLIPIGRVPRSRLMFSSASMLFHAGLILSLLFLRNHLDILGAAWPALGRPFLDGVTLLAIVGGAYLLVYRVYVRRARALSGVADYGLLVILLNLLMSGFVAGQVWNPIPYDGLMLFHTLNGLTLMVLMPFTKITHCVLYPLARLSTELAWRFTPRGGSDAIETLYGPEGRRI
jgi:nitrate reductase gamma subunit